MEVVAHEAPGMDLPASLGCDLSEEIEEHAPILIIGKDIPARITARHEVIRRAWKLNTLMPSHAGWVAKTCSYGNNSTLTLVTLRAEYPA